MSTQRILSRVKKKVLKEYSNSTQSNRVMWQSQYFSLLCENMKDFSVSLNYITFTKSKHHSVLVVELSWTQKAFVKNYGCVKT